jgi:hypothetical protein
VELDGGGGSTGRGWESVQVRCPRLIRRLPPVMLEQALLVLLVLREGRGGVGRKEGGLMEEGEGERALTVKRGPSSRGDRLGGVVQDGQRRGRRRRGGR